MMLGSRRAAALCAPCSRYLFQFQYGTSNHANSTTSKYKGAAAAAAAGGTHPTQKTPVADLYSFLNQNVKHEQPVRARFPSSE